jgi:hypothetical protein
MSLIYRARLVLLACACAAAILVGFQGATGGSTAALRPGTASSDTTCTTGPGAGFDFWIGTWALSWEGGHGTNRIRRILGGCVIEEQFVGHMNDSTVYRGRSYTVYDASAGVWKQTWVDDRGGYLDFTQDTAAAAKEADARMILSRAGGSDASPMHFRMVWRDVEGDRLTWHWQRRYAADTTWTTLWAITYQRGKD